MIKIYTDGATSGNGYEGSKGGWAFLAVKEDIIICESIGRKMEATNNQCELSALIDACEWAAKDPAESYEVYTDSAYCLNCYREGWYKKWVNNGWVNSKREPVKNRDLWEKLIPYFECGYISFHKVKGHSGDFYNEKVDELAVRARESL